MTALTTRPKPNDYGCGGFLASEQPWDGCRLLIAAGVVDKLIHDLELTDRVTFTGLRRQMPAPRHQAVPSDLLEAVAWFLAHARPEQPRSPNGVVAASRSEMASAAEPRVPPADHAVARSERS